MLGQKIKEYLASNGIMQSFVCEKTGISAPTLCAMLNGNRKILAEEYFLICSALNLDFKFFYEVTENEVG